MDVKNKSSVSNSLHILLNGNYDKYDLKLESTMGSTSNDKLQKILSSINEKTDIRKKNGVYYTPEDVCKYIILNSIIMSIDKNNARTYKENE